MMKTSLLILCIILCVGLKSQSQSSGYVLWNSDGTIRIPSNTLAISQINTLQTALDAKAPLASPSFTTPALGTPASGNFSSGTFTWPTFNQNTSGSAATLTTSRNIQGVAFNGSASIDIINGTGFVKATGTTLSYDNSTYLTTASAASTYQPLDADLTTIAGLTATTDNFMVSVSSAWASRTPTQVKTTLALNNVTNESKATMFTSPTFTGTPVVPGYQPLATNLTSIGALANASGYLKNNGSGTFTYETPAGAGTVTNTGTLTSNSVVLGNGTTDVKVVAGVTTDGTAQLVLGVNTTTLGSVKMFGNTSGDATIQPAAVAGTATVITLPNVTSTLLPNTTTSGVAATATASGTQTVTHNLGRIPTTIRIYSISSFTSNAAATPVPFSMGVFNSSGNRCVYMVINGTTTQVSQTSTTFSIIMVTSAGNQITGVIQNLTSTGFDIVWTETGTHTAGNFVWEAQ